MPETMEQMLARLGGQGSATVGDALDRLSAEADQQLTTDPPAPTDDGGVSGHDYYGPASAGDRIAQAVRGYAALPKAIVQGAASSAARGVVGAGHAAGVVPDDVLALANDEDRRIQEENARAIAGAPGAPTIMRGGEMVAGVAPLAIPGVGVPLTAATMGGGSYADALENGATPAQARTAGALVGAVGAALPVAGRVVAPVARLAGARAGKVVPTAAKPVAAAIAEHGVQGAAAGTELGVADAIATADYDPELARQKLAAVPREALEMALLGGAAAGAGVAAGRLLRRMPQPQEKPTPVDPNAQTRVDLDPITAEDGPPDFVPPEGWDPRFGTPKHIEGPGSVLSREPTPQDLSDHAAELAKRSPTARALVEARHFGDETVEMPTLTEESLAGAPMPAGGPKRVLKPQVPPDMPTTATRELDVEEVQRAAAGADLAREENAVVRAKRARADAEAGMAEEEAKREDVAAMLRRVQSEENASQTGEHQAVEDAKAIEEEQARQDHTWRQTFIQRMAAGRAHATAQRQASAEKDVQWRTHVAQQLRQARTGVTEKTQVANPYAQARPDPSAEAGKRLDAVRSEEEAPSEPVAAAPARPVEEEATPAERPALPEPAPVPPAEPEHFQPGDRVHVEFKGRQIAGEVQVKTGSGDASRYRVQADDGRVFPAVMRSRLSQEPARAPASHPASRPVPGAPAAAAPRRGSPPPVAPPRADRAHPAPPWPAPTRTQPATAAAPAGTPAPRLTADTLRAQMRAAAPAHIKPEMVDAAMELVSARARSADVSLDDYVGRHFAGAHRAVDEPSLNQKDTLLQEKPLADATMGAAPVTKGAVQFLRDGRAIIHVFEHGDASTLVHELGHVFRRDLTAGELAAAERWAGVRNGKWTRRAEEQFARGFERYVRDGVAPTPELRPVFQRFFTWLREIYHTVTGSAIDITMTPEIKRVMDRLLTSKAMAGRDPAPAPLRETPAPERETAPPVRETKPSPVETTAPRAPESPKVDVPAPEDAGKGLANYGTSEPVREQARALDEQRAADGKPEHKPQADDRAEADRRLADDYESAKRTVFNQARAGQPLDRVQVVMAQRILEREGREALAKGDPKAMQDFAALHNAYRDARAETARSLAIGRDPTETPIQRMRRLLTDSIYTPPATYLRAIKAARDAARKAIENGDTAGAEQARQRERAVVKRAGDHLLKVRKSLERAGVDLLYQGEDPVQLARIANEACIANGTAHGVMREFFVNSILSGPKTFTVNAVGTPLNAAWRMGIERVAEATMNLVAQKADAASFAEYRHMARGILPGLQQALGDALMTFNAERSVFRGEIDERHLVQDKGYGGPQISGLKGRIIRLPTRLTSAADQLWKTWIAHVEVGAHAHRLAKQAGLAGDELSQRIRELVADHESEAWTRAKDEALHSAFQGKEGKASDLVLKVRNYQVGDTDFRPLFYLMPFVRTPMQIVSQGLKRTPLGAVRMAYRWARASEMKPYEAREALRDASEQIVSFAVTAALMGVATATDENGVPYITGTSGNYDAGKAELRQRTATDPTTIRIPGTDIRLNYGRVEPFATTLSSLVDLIQAGGRALHGQATGDTIEQLKDAAAGQLTDKTFIKGIGDVVQSFRTKGGGQFWSNFATSWIPAVIRAPQRDADPYVREGRTWGNGVDYWKMLGENVAAKAFAPWSDNRRISVWGQDIAKSDPAPATDVLFRAARVVSPVDARVESVSSLDRLLLNWNNDPKNKTYYPRFASPTYTERGQQRSMTQDEYERYARRAGELAAERLVAAKLNVDHPTPRDIERMQAELRRARKQARFDVIRSQSVSEDDQ